MADTTADLTQADLTWADIGGLEDAKGKLQQSAELPLRNPAAFARLGIRPARGFLLYGPPGNGKAMLVSALAHAAKAKVIAISPARLLQAGFESASRKIAEHFEEARIAAPCIVFIDEIECVAPARAVPIVGEMEGVTRLVSTLIAELDGLEGGGVIVIGATARPLLLDSALMRPGRLDELIYVGLPDAKGREAILKRLTVAMPLAKDVSLGKIADQTDRFTGADLEDVVRRAGIAALHKRGDTAKTIIAADFTTALADSRATVSPEMEGEYQKLKGELKKPTAAAVPAPVGFLAPGMVEPVRDRKHA